ncbi:LacI family transcriptional regulator [Echinicola pacifica]|uniref:LacI family transcriptional regulator n=1 Tax=Echinicola pacifica TaxID=346377 RepID=A0A918PW63_9BACT|nr:LacI family DNA-binding transcriptional regulator [Echinicola pacifica]GGZ22636.1 LacI family transcriptional regulator [Echinicola pacifica]
MKKGQVTIRDIALKLNISISTVSRALRDSPEIKLETRKKVLALAEKLNYTPNVVAQSLRVNKTKTLGIVVPELASHFFASNISGIQDTAYKRGYNVMICQSNENFEQEKSDIRTLISSRVDGLLISLSRETSSFEHLQHLIDREIPFVLFDRIVENLPVSTVTVDDSLGAYNVVQHLLQQGCQKIAFISGPKEMYICKKRIDGYQKALEEAELQHPYNNVQFSDLTNEDIRRITHELLDQEERPDAIFALNDPVAVEVLKVLKAKGLSVPEDIALVGFTNMPFSDALEPSLSTVDQPAYEMGRLAANNLLDQLMNPADFQPKNLVLDTELVIRHSSSKNNAMPKG